MPIIKRVIRRLLREINNVTAPKRECNICKKRFRGRFEPIHPMYLENSLKTGFPYFFEDTETLNYKEYSCPYCGSSDRDRLYALYLNKALNKNRSYSMLDIAPAPALQKFLKSLPQVVYRSADLMIAGVDDKVDITDMDIYHDNMFDVFICSHVLEHVNDDRKAMQELYRILKKDGLGICMVPIVLPLKEIDEDITITDPQERWKRFGQDDHVRLYSRKGFIERLQEAGFNVEEVTINNFSKTEFILYGISPRSVLYIVGK